MAAEAKKKRSPAFAIFARINPDLGRRLQERIESLRPKTTVAAIIEMLVEDYLATPTDERRAK